MYRCCIKFGMQQQSLLVGKWTRGREPASMPLLLCGDQTFRHGSYFVAPGSLGENEKHVFLMLPRRARARLYVHVQATEEFIVVPTVFVANAAEMSDGRR